MTVLVGSTATSVPATMTPMPAHIGQSQLVKTVSGSTPAMPNGCSPSDTAAPTPRAAYAASCTSPVNRADTGPSTDPSSSDVVAAPAALACRRVSATITTATRTVAHRTPTPLKAADPIIARDRPTAHHIGTGGAWSAAADLAAALADLVMGTAPAVGRLGIEQLPDLVGHAVGIRGDRGLHPSAVGVTVDVGRAHFA